MERHYDYLEISDIYGFDGITSLSVYYLKKNLQNSITDLATQAYNKCMIS